MSEIPRIGRLRPGDAEDSSGAIDSMPLFGMSELDSEDRVVLKDWSAQDFANIYVRFRPHLISHAGKFLREESQAEEVVQDAFLYLMTSLPDLDSELGVLRFLKWKTKMLCLDIIRASQSRMNNYLVPLPDEIPDEVQPHDSLERADDAAIIRLALAKLSPRHRHALIATMYEEKSHEEVAQQMGVSQNAFRQLVYRARAAFRMALVGESSIEGKSASQILTVASKRIATNSSKALSILVLVAIGGWVMVATPYPPEPRERVLSAPISGIRDDRLLSSEDGKEFPVEGSGTSPSGPLRFSDTKLADATTVPEAPFPQPDLAEGEKLGGDDSVEVVGAFVEEVRFEMDTFLDLGLAGLELGYSRASAYSPEANVVLLESASGLRASFLVSNDGGVLVEQSHFSIVVDGYEFVLAPSVTLATVSETPRGTAISFGASDFVVGDFGGQFENLTTTSAEISHLKLRADFIVDDFGNIFESMLGSAITL